MLYRRLHQETKSRLAIWSLRLAFFSLLSTVLSIIIARGDMLETLPALATFAAALLLSVIAILFALGAFAVIWHSGYSGVGPSLGALAIAAGILAYPAYLGATSFALPPIWDITTDLNDPPQFQAVARLKPTDRLSPLAYPGEQFARAQRAAYPDVEPLLTTRPPAEVYQRALEAVNQRHWQVLESQPPQPARRQGRVEVPAREGRIDAVARSPIMGFRDDIALRIRAAGDQTRLDMRSSSRHGLPDLGANAARLRAFLEDIDAILNTETPAPPPPPPPQRAPKAPPAKR
jgi:hypothetical protein